MIGSFGLRGVGAVIGLAAAMSLTGPAGAQDAEEFYRGKTVTLTVGLPAGGVYGLYARLLSEFMTRHTPGRPTIVTQYMTAAGGLTGANHLANAAPRDGTHISILFKDVVITQKLRPDAAKYDAKQFRWIGRIVHYNAVLVVSGESGIKTIQDASNREVIMGAMGGKATGSYMLPTMLNTLAGTKFKIISGYQGAAGMTLAMDRGETHGWAGGHWLGFKGPRADDLRDGKVVVLMQSGDRREPELADVPLMRELPMSDDARKVVEFIDSSNVLGIAVAAPPDVPDPVVAVLRKSFDATMKDPAFVAEVRKRNIDVAPMSGAALEKVVADTLGTAPETIARARAILQF